MTTTISLPSASPFASLATIRQAIEDSTRPAFLAGGARGANRPVLVVAMLAVSATTLVCALAGKGPAASSLAALRAPAIVMRSPTVTAQAGLSAAGQWWGAAPTPTTPPRHETVATKEPALRGPLAEKADPSSAAAVAFATSSAPRDTAPTPAEMLAQVSEAPAAAPQGVPAVLPAEVPLPPPSPTALANAIREAVPLPPPRPGLHPTMTAQASAVQAPAPRPAQAAASSRHDVAPTAPPSVQVASAPADTRGFLEKFFSFGRPTNALGYAAAEDGALSGAPDRYTAVYNIASHTVTLPDGTRLEAHSGLGAFMDDPSHANAPMRGVTPPHVYDLSLRESSFHGVQAIRLNPVGGGGIYGRVGLLAHSYMLGQRGDSNGCVSFRDYNAFLQAFRSGQVRRLLVIARSA